MSLLSKLLLLLVILFIQFFQLNGQSVNYNFEGFIKSDIFRDSREISSARQGHFLLYPLNAQLDAEGNDINDISCFHILPIQSRLIFTINDKELSGAKAFAKIEGEFFGNSEIGINSFRLRHAFFRVDWTRSSLLVGQFWHPLFIETHYPSTISFNTGVPFIPLSRNPQIRYTYKTGDIAFSLTVFSQLDFKSTGPDGPQVSYAVHGIYPATNFRMVYQPNSKSGVLKYNTGFSLNTKRLKPTLTTLTGYKDDTFFRTYAATAFFGVKNSKMGIKLQGTFGEDLYNLTMIGGYGVHSTIDETKQLKNYTANRTSAFWADIHNIHPTHNFGIMMGYTKNNGSKDNQIGDYYGRGKDIAYVYRISPRYSYKKGNFKVAAELEYTAAAYGEPDDFGIIKNSNEYGNLRILTALYYYFNTSFN